jgi:prepilin-type N-terminal cleavage/methylation domain-containing protein
MIMSSAHNRLQAEDGFSLIELLAAMVIGSIVLTALMTVFVGGVTGSSRVQDRVDAASRGRLAMDRVTSLLDSQVCVVTKSTDGLQDLSLAPIVPAVSNASSVTFYGDFNGASATPNRYTITHNAAAKTLSLTTATGTGTFPNVTYGTPRTVQLAEYVVPAVTGSGTAVDIFQYFPFQDDGSVSSDPATKVIPSTDAIASTIVRVAVNFRVLSSRTKVVDPRAATLQGEAGVATYDPTNKAICP